MSSCHYNKKAFMLTGIHGRIFSSDIGGPLPASVMIKGIDYAVNASKIFGDYHRMLAPGESYEVTATMSGFKSKTTKVLLGDEAVSLDFVLDPEAGFMGEHPAHSKPNNSGLLKSHMDYYPIVFLAFLMFLCFLLKRRAIFKFLRHRQSHGQKRPTAVLV